MFVFISDRIIFYFIFFIHAFLLNLCEHYTFKSLFLWRCFLAYLIKTKLLHYFTLIPALHNFSPRFRHERPSCVEINVRFRQQFLEDIFVDKPVYLALVRPDTVSDSRPLKTAEMIVWRCWNSFPLSTPIALAKSFRSARYNGNTTYVYGNHVSPDKGKTRWRERERESGECDVRQKKTETKGVRGEGEGRVMAEEEKTERYS